MICAVPLSGVVKDPEKFHDREDEIREIARLLENGGDVAVVGEPGIGKSTVLWWLYRKAENKEILKNWKVIYIDMQGVTSKEELLRSALRELDGQVVRDGPYTSLKEKFEDSIKGRKIVLILDEFDKVRELPKVFDKNFRDWLRSLAQSREFDLVISIRKEPSIAFKDSGFTSPFYNIFQVQRIEPFDREMVVSYAQKYGINPKTGERIFKLTEGHPRLVNLAVYAWCKWTYDGKIKSKYRSWEAYFKELRGAHEPPKSSRVKQILGSTWMWIDRIALCIVGSLGTAMIIDDQLYSLMVRVTHTHPPLYGGLFIVYLISLALTSLAAGLLLASLGLEGIVKLVALMK